MKKLLTLLFALSLSVATVSAQDAKAVDAVIYSTTFYYQTNHGMFIDKSETAKAEELLSELEQCEDFKVDIKGWSDISGGVEFNNTLAAMRAKAVYNYLIKNGIDAECITYEGCGIDRNSAKDKARRADVVVRGQVIEQAPAATSEAEEAEEAPVTPPVEDARAAEPVEDIDTEMQVEPEPETAAAAVEESHKSTCRESFTLRTNLLYWLGGMMNLGVEYKRPESDFGFVLNGGYSFLGQEDWKNNFGGWFVSPEVRYYFPKCDQWFIGAQFLAGGYNIKLSDIGRQGKVLCGGLMGGYKLPLSDTFDMDFTLGLGYGHLSYDTYQYNETTDTSSRLMKGAEIKSIVPIQAGVNLIWKFN